MKCLNLNLIEYLINKGASLSDRYSIYAETFLLLFWIQYNDVLLKQQLFFKGLNNHLNLMISKC